MKKVIVILGYVLMFLIILSPILLDSIGIKPKYKLSWKPFPGPYSLMRGDFDYRDYTGGSEK